MNAQMSTLSVYLVAQGVCLAACVAATVVDQRERRIPNVISYGAIATGLVLSGVDGALGSALVAALVLGGSFGLFYALGAAGMGDVKLMLGVGLLLRWPLSLFALVYVLAAGGLVACAHALRRRELRSVLANLRRMRPGGRPLATPSTPAPPLHRMPYALAILLGVAWTLTRLHLPGLSLP
jgi:prepilin peptidase CpaA